MTLTRKLEAGFERLGKASCDYPWFFITLSLAIFVFFSWQLRFAVMDTSTEGFLKRDDPALVAYENFRAEFGRDESFLVAIETDNVFAPEFIPQLIALHQALEREVPHLDDVTSLYNARNIYGANDELVVEDLLENLPETAEGYAELRQKALAHPLYRNSFVSEDGTVANLQVRPLVHVLKKDKEGKEVRQLLGEQEIHEIFTAIEKVLAEKLPKGAKAHIAGSPAMTEELNVYLVGDMARFIFLVLGVIAVSLFILFRRLVAVILPLLVVGLALVSTMGLMALTKQPIQMPTVILPSFVLAVGVGVAIHLLTIFYLRIRKGDEKKQAIANTLHHSGLAVFFTSLTTAASLCTFGNSDILPVANLGLFAAAGVMFSFLYGLLLLPALLMVAPLTLPPEEVHQKVTLADRFIEFSIFFTTRYPLPIVVVSVLLMVFTLYTAMQLPFSHDPVKWLPEESPGRQSVYFLDEKIKGSVSIEIVIDTGKVDGVKDAAFMAMLDDLVNTLEKHETDRVKVGKVLSVVHILRETNQALFDNDPAAYHVPDNRELIAQELLMLETSGARDLYRLVDSNYQKARVTVMIPWLDAVYLGDYSREIEQLVKEKVGSQGEVEVTGIVPMLARTLKQIMSATAFSYVAAFVVIAILMVFLLGSVKYGLVSMLPNLLPITFAMAMMHINGAPLDMFTMLIGSIAIGLAVDDTIHFMHGFRRNLDRGKDPVKAVEDTLHSSGRAMLATSVVLVSGFLIYLFSMMNNLQNFGFYTALCIVVALLADFWMAPALVLLMNRKKGVTHG